MHTHATNTSAVPNVARISRPLHTAASPVWRPEIYQLTVRSTFLQGHHATMARSSLRKELDIFRERVLLLGLKPGSTLVPKRRDERLAAVEAAAAAILGERVTISKDSTGKLVMDVKAFSDGAVQPEDDSEEEAAELLHEWRRMKLSVRNLLKLRRRFVTVCG